MKRFWTVFVLFCIGWVFLKNLREGKYSAAPEPNPEQVEAVEQLLESILKQQRENDLYLSTKVLGTYEHIKDGDTNKLVLLENGISEAYKNGKRQVVYKWEIAAGEIHLDDYVIGVCRINEDSSITKIAYIVDGNRTDVPKEGQRTYKKIK